MLAEDRQPAPLQGIRVLDLGTRISGPFCAGLLGELGADVIKIEDPKHGDMLRTIGPYDEGYSLWWSVEGRNRRSATCDLRTEVGQQYLRRLASKADVLVENFRPGTMERWGLGPADLPDSLVYVRVSGFGQEGPYSQRPSLDRVGVAMGGLLYITGESDGPPMRLGINLSDYLSGLFAALGAVAALRRRETNTPLGEVVDSSLYGSVMRILEWTLAAHDRTGVIRERNGNRSPNTAPADAYRTSDDRFVSIVAAGDVNFRRLCRAMECPELADDERFATVADRATASLEINEIVASWVAGRSATDVMEVCIAHEVPVAVAYSAADIMSDPHIIDRGDVISVQDPVIGPVRQQAPQPRLLRSEQPTLTGAPTLGQHNEDVWIGLVGLTREEFSDARNAGVI